MRKLSILLLFVNISLLSFAQSKGETLFLKVESDYNELHLDRYNHSLIQIRTGYEETLQELIKENNNLLAGEVLCRLGEMTKDNDRRTAKEYYLKAIALVEGCNSNVELKAEILLAELNSKYEDPDSVWEIAQSYPDIKDGLFSLEDEIFLLNELALIAERAKEYLVSLQIYDYIESLDCKNNCMALCRQIKALTDYSDLLLNGHEKNSELVMMECADSFDYLADVIEGIPDIFGKYFYSLAASFEKNKEYYEAFSCYVLAISYYQCFNRDNFDELILARDGAVNTLVKLDMVDEVYEIIEVLGTVPVPVQTEELYISSIAQSSGESLFLKAESDYNKKQLSFYDGKNITYIEFEYKVALLKLLYEQNHILASKALCRLGEIKLRDESREARDYISWAVKLVYGSYTNVELEAELLMASWDSYFENPVEAWERVKGLESRIDSIVPLEDKIYYLDELAMIANRAGDINESMRLFRVIQAIDSEKNRMAEYRQILAMAEYSDAFVSRGFGEESLMIIDDCLDRFNNLIDDINGLPDIVGRLFYSYASSFKINKEYEEAVSSYRLAMEYFQEIYGDDNLWLIRAREQLGSTLVQLDSKEDIYEGFRELDTVIAQAKRIIGDNHYELMNAYATYSFGLLRLKEYDKAREKVLESVRIAQTIKSTNPIPYVDLVMLEWLTGNYEAMLESVRVVFNISKERIRQEMIAFSEREWELYWINYGAPILSLIASASANVEDDDGLLFDAALFSKGILLSVSSQLRKIINSDESGELLRTRNNYRALYAKANMLSQGDSVSQLEAEKVRLEARNVEEELIMLSGELGDYMQGSQCSWRDVETVLKDDEVAIEFIRNNETGKSDKYLAAVLRRGSKPVVVSFPELNDDYIIKQSKKKAYTSSDFYSKLFVPLLPYLDNCKTIWFSPSGALCSIAIENLKISRNKYASDVYTIRRVSSTKELVKEMTYNKWETATLFGGLDYNLNSDEMEYYSTTLSASRGTESLHDWRYLNGSLEEVEAIDKLLYGVSTEVVTDGLGVKERFINLSGKGISLIHIATHGYYDEDVAEMVGNYASTIEEEAMQTCGLVFSGANNKDMDGSGVGLLSAAEIAEMDLTGCDLAVLSACGTGLNIINYDESYGLMRAFKKAGCKSLLLTLWDIDDAVTKLFMQEFYTARMSGATNSCALDLAKKTVRNKYKSPRYWAGFILID